MFGSDSPIAADFLMLSFSQDLILSDLEVLEWQAYFVEAIGSYQVVTLQVLLQRGQTWLHWSVVVPGLALVVGCKWRLFAWFLVRRRGVTTSQHNCGSISAGSQRLIASLHLWCTLLLARRALNSRKQWSCCCDSAHKNKQWICARPS